MIALLGVGPCFLINALSFGAMIVALWGMDPRALDTPEPAPRRRGDLRSGLAYVRRTPALLIPLAMMALVGTLSYNFQILLPLLADFTWHGTATTYALLTTAMGVGSVLGALAAGARGRVDSRLLVWAAAAFGVLMLAAAAAPTLPLQIAALVPLGMVTVTFAAGVNSTLQLAVDPAMRGRVMALYSVVFLGSTPIGAPLVGWLAGAAGPRAGLVVGALAALLAAALRPDRVRAGRRAGRAGGPARAAPARLAGAGGGAVARPAAARLPRSMASPREGRVRVPIRWRDLDLLGHVNQSVYHELLEEGRGALFARLEENSFPFVLVHIELDYRTEVRRDHELGRGRLPRRPHRRQERDDRGADRAPRRHRRRRGPQRAGRLGPGGARPRASSAPPSASRSAP